MEVIDPLEAEIVSRYPKPSVEAGSSIHVEGHPDRVVLSSNTDEEEGSTDMFSTDKDSIGDKEQIAVGMIVQVERKLHVPVSFVPSCEDMDSSMNVDRLERLRELCNPGCNLVIPSGGERCHRFNNFEPDQSIPNAVLSASFFKLGFSLPLHPFFTDVLNFYDIAPMQLSPNSFRVAACMYILYDQTFSVPLTARELGYFYQLKDVGRKVGIFYLTSWNNRQGKCIKGNKRGMYDWLEMFLYCYDCEEVRKEWNLTPGKHSVSLHTTGSTSRNTFFFLIQPPFFLLYCLGIPAQTSLQGIEEKRARKIMKLAGSLRDGESLLIPETLMRLGFSRHVAPPSPAHEMEVEDKLERETKPLGTKKRERKDGASTGSPSGILGCRSLCLLFTHTLPPNTSYLFVHRYLLILAFL